MQKFSKLILILSVIILLAGFAAFYYIHSHYISVSYEAEIPDETAEVRTNPYCGFYHMTGYVLSEDSSDTAAQWSRQFLSSDDTNLILLQINLRNYQNTDLSDSALAQLDTILDAFSSDGRILIVRFLYDWNGQASSTEPSSIGQIRTHMVQTSAVINRYADYVYLLQGDFTGDCGEMHGTAYSSADDLRTLMQQLMDVTDDSIYLSVRTPAQWRTVAQSNEPLCEDTASVSDSLYRLGLFNDGMLGSANDLGTYGDTQFTADSDFEKKGTRDQELAFQSQLCRFVPNGGEVVIDNSYNDAEAAIDTLSTMHVSYLNAEHDTAVLDKWKQTLWQSDDLWNDVTVYDYIAAHLGYRYVLTDATLFNTSFHGEETALSVTIENRGFSPAYRSFDTALLLTDSSNGTVIRLSVDWDNRTLSSEEAVSFTIPLDVTALADGSYALSLSITDPASGQTVLWGNSCNTDGSVSLGTLLIKRPY
jgi:hypothetical protein